MKMLIPRAGMIDFIEVGGIEPAGLALQGILWLVCVIPAILLGLAMWIISKYELTDDVIDDINKKIEERASAEK